MQICQFEYTSARYVGSNIGLAAVFSIESVASFLRAEYFSDIFRQLGND